MIGAILWHGQRLLLLRVKRRLFGFRFFNQFADVAFGHLWIKHPFQNMAIALDLLIQFLALITATAFARVSCPTG
jgi:hypothetical protein